MSQDAGKKRGNLTLEDGGLRTPRTVDDELERRARELFFAMRRKDGASVNKNFRNVARGHIHPLRVLMRRFKEAKAARNDAHNYPLMKQTIRDIDAWVDALHGKRQSLSITGEFTPPPAAPQKKAA